MSCSKHTTSDDWTNLDSDCREVIIVSPGLLEPGTRRGGGCEVTDYRVGYELSKNVSVRIIGPLWEHREPRIIDNSRFSIDYLPFPAVSEYPPRTQRGSVLQWVFVTLFYSLIVAAKTIPLMRKGMRIIVVHNAQTGLLLALAGRVLGTRIVYSEGNITPWYSPSTHSNGEGSLRKFWRLVNLPPALLLSLLSNTIRAQSESIKQGMMNRGVSQSKIKVIPAGVDLDFTEGSCSNAVTDSTGRKVAYVGRLTQEKNIHMLMKVCKIAAERLPDVRFQIYGDGPYREDLLAIPNVELVEQTPHDQLRGRLGQVNIVMTFQKELGRSEIECMAYGKVLLAQKLGEMTSVLEHKRNAFLCEPNPESCVEAIEQIIADRLLMESISLGAISLVAERHDWRRIGREWTRLCLEGVDKHSHAIQGHDAA